jgi:catechol 2,3-dioxygenase-like lactoylglutathione lyase family enzyme
MTEARVTNLRYVAVGVENFDSAVDFYRTVWGLKRIDGEKDVAYFAAEGSPEQFVYRVRRAPENRLDLLAFGAQDEATVDELASRLAADGVRFVSEPGQIEAPGGGYGFRFFDPDGRVVEVSSGVAEGPSRTVERNEAIPVKLSHVVVSSPNKEQADSFYREKLGFKLSDWVPYMTFLRCNTDHHSLAIAGGGHAALNHVAFEVGGIDEMMRGAGRVMKDGRGMPAWGPGRHYAGDNTFYYFYDPIGNVSEYTAEVEQILDDAVWTPKENPPEDQWGTAKRYEELPAGGANRNRPDPGVWQAPPI